MTVKLLGIECQEGSGFSMAQFIAKLSEYNS